MSSCLIACGERFLQSNADIMVSIAFESLACSAACECQASLVCSELLDACRFLPIIRPLCMLRGQCQLEN